MLTSHAFVRYYCLLKYMLDRSTTHPKFKFCPIASRPWTLRTFYAPETLLLTTEPSGFFRANHAQNVF